MAEGKTGRAGPPKNVRSLSKDRMIGAVLDGKYTLKEKIGEGGMGSVYTAIQASIDRKVAVKVLLSKLADDQVAVKRFEQEAIAISKMQHPNTVTIYDFGRVEDPAGERLYIVMEFLKGRTLSQLLRREGPLPGPRASRILRQVCASLQDAHAAGIIHRDLKPDNIFLTELGGDKDWVKVLDFGVAKLVNSESAGTLTQTGMIFGTPKYMSPEQAEGKQIDPRVDLYALGVVLYELLTGKPPFSAETPVALLLKHISNPPPPLSAVSELKIDPWLESIVMKALEKKADRRHQSAAELAFELDQYERSVLGSQSIPSDGGRLGSVSGPGPRPPTFTGQTMPEQADRIPTQVGAAETAPALAHGSRRPTSLSARLSAELSGLRQLGGGGGEAKQGFGRWLIAFGVAFVVGVGGFSIWKSSSEIVQVRSVPASTSRPAEKSQVPPQTAELEEGPKAEGVKTAGAEAAPPSLRHETTVQGAEQKALNRKVKVTLESTPSKALVRLSGRQIGVTPLVVELARQEDEATFVFSKRGFTPRRIRRSLKQDLVIRTRLSAKASAPGVSTPVARCKDGSKPPCKVKAVDLRVDDLK